MDYATFFSRFGASARTKHIRNTSENRRKKNEKRGRSAFPLPATSEMPKEFIRLCPWEMEYLFSVACQARQGILETGRYNGGSLFVMACAAPDDVPIYSIDIAPRDDRFLREKLAEHCPGKSIDLIVGDSQKSRYSQIGAVDLLFIDGDHTYEGCMNDICNWYENLLPNGHLVFHDAYLGQHGVQAAIIDFMRDHRELQAVQSPVIGASHWEYPAGSIAHLVKRPAS